MVSEPSVPERVKSAERVLDILEALSATNDGMTFSALQQTLQIPKSSLHVLLDVLTRRSYLEYNAETRRYSLGIRIWEAGQAYQSRHTLIRVASAIMESIVATINETVQLATLDGAENVYLAKVDSSHPLRLQSEVGKRLTAHATALGKMLLAHLPEQEVRTRFAGRLNVRLTANTIMDNEQLVEELRRTRERGFSIDNQEYTPGLFCVAVPIYSHQKRIIAAMSVSVPAVRASLELFADGLALLAQGSLQISQRMGSTVSDEHLARLQNRDLTYRLLAELNERIHFSMVSETLSNP